MKVSSEQHITIMWCCFMKEGHKVPRNPLIGNIPLNQINKENSVFTKINEVVNTHLTKTWQPCKTGFPSTPRCSGSESGHQVPIWATREQASFLPNLFKSQQTTWGGWIFFRLPLKEIFFLVHHKLIKCDSLTQLWMEQGRRNTFPVS